MMEKLEKIETDIAYLQAEIAQLNEIVTEQQLLVAKLEKQNEYLAKKLEEIDSEDRPNKKPPHY